MIATPAGYSVFRAGHQPCQRSHHLERPHGVLPRRLWGIAVGREHRHRHATGAAVAGLGRSHVLARGRRTAIRRDARRRVERNLRPALHFRSGGAQHALGALPRQLRAHAELHHRGLRRAVCRERAILRLRRGTRAAEQGAARVWSARQRDDTDEFCRRHRHRDRWGDELFPAAARLPATLFRSNLVLRWEWLPGSTAFLVWQQSRFGQVTDGELVRPQDLWNSVRADGDNFFVMKVSYWIGRR